MARIKTLPSLEIIRGLKGILDFYVWRGLPCVRAWPRYRPARQTEASLAAALLFGAIIKAYSLLGACALEAYRADAADHNRTARDIMVSGVYGKLHEASMSDFLDLLTECRDFLSNLTALLDALHSIDTDELVVRVEHSVLPDSASTAAAQATQLTALQKLDDLQDALESKALDRLLVRGMDQLFTYKEPVNVTRTATISGAGGYLQSNVPPGGTLWVIHTVVTSDDTSPTTEHQYTHRRAGVNVPFHNPYQAFAASRRSSWGGLVILAPGEWVRIYYIGALAGDTCTVSLTGFAMTLET